MKMVTTTTTTTRTVLLKSRPRCVTINRYRSSRIRRHNSKHHNRLASHHSSPNTRLLINNRINSHFSHRTNHRRYRERPTMVMQTTLHIATQTHKVAMCLHLHPPLSKLTIHKVTREKTSNQPWTLSS